MLLTIQELFDILIMSIAVGFIFMKYFPVERKYAITYAYFDLQALKNSIIITAPSLIFHELAHKFTALVFGINATFHAAYSWLVFGLILHFMNFPFIFFVPGYVSVQGYLPPLQDAMVSFAGPLLNLLLFLGSYLVLKYYTLSRRTTIILSFTKQINLFLFIFNMLPIPPFDGWQVYSSLIRAFTG